LELILRRITAWGRFPVAQGLFAVDRPEMIQGSVDGDAAEPGIEIAAFLEPGKGAVGSDERFLGQVVGRLGAPAILKQRK
jgi:hypothetical protein